MLAPDTTPRRTRDGRDPEQGVFTPVASEGGGSMRLWRTRTGVVLLSGVTLFIAVGAWVGSGGRLRFDGRAMKPQMPEPVDQEGLMQHDFQSKLVLFPGKQSEWVSFPISDVPKLFGEKEIEAMPMPGRPAHCDNSSIPEHCCVGSTSLLGYTTWFETACKHANFLQMPVNATDLRDMADVMSLLGPGSTLTFVGDSVTSQHAHAAECSWLRSGKTVTLDRTTKDSDHVFDKNGTVNVQRSKYGTNFVKRWTVTNKHGDGAGLNSTVQLVMQYRPVNNTGNGESAEEYGADSNVLVLNFALHYLQPDWEAEYRPEMTAMLKSLIPFASTPGKVLVWREASAQHHLSDGGEWPAWIGGTGLREETFEAFKDRCHTLRFRHNSFPQYRDKVVIRVAAALGYTVQAVGVHPEDCKGTDFHLAPDGRHCVKSPWEPTPSGPDGLPLDGPILYWLPFYGLTAERQDLHPYNHKKFQYDCTHFCFTPYLWAPLADGLANAVEEAQARSRRLGLSPPSPSSSSSSSRPAAAPPSSGEGLVDRQRAAEDHRSTAGVSHRKFVGCVTTADGECVETPQP